MVLQQLAKGLQKHIWFKTHSNLCAMYLVISPKWPHTVMDGNCENRCLAAVAHVQSLTSFCNDTTTHRSLRRPVPTTGVDGRLNVRSC